MEINIYGPSTDASLIKGFTIVVDVFRAFSLAYYIEDCNPIKYIVTNDVDHAFELKKQIPNSLLIGERKGIKIDGFDFGNSPTEIIGNDFSKNNIIHTTSAGTKGLLLQPIENDVVVGSFVNCKALINYIKKNDIHKVNIYCTAEKKPVIGEEDYLFAEYLKNELTEKRNNYDSIVEKLRKGSGKRFEDEEFVPYTDFVYCMDLNRFNTILKRKIVKNQLYEVELELNRKT